MNPLGISQFYYHQCIGSIIGKGWNNWKTFGYWFSPDMVAEPGKLYRAQFYVLSDQVYRSLTPGFRMRLNTKNGHLGASYVVNSQSDADSSPDKWDLQVYNVYLPMRENVEKFVSSIDILNFDPKDAYTGSIILGHCAIDSCPAELIQ